ncbi:MAG TPA: VpsF family polysaccharide biosynthesis protein [Stenotrophomonas sp.]|jgi:hypothetical protein
MNAGRLLAAHTHDRARWAYRCALLALACQLTVSAPALTAMGIPYSLPYGSFVFKFHPATYLMSLALLLSLLADGNPVVVLAQRLRDNPLLMSYLGCMVAVCGYALMRHGGSGAAFYIDALVMPAIAVLVLLRLDGQQRRQALRLMFGLLLLNAVIALGESAAGRSFIPLNISGKLLTFGGDFRASALLGHPLGNGLITCVMLLAMLDLPMAVPGKLAAVALFMLALLAFGGRASVVLGTAALLAFAARTLWRGLGQGRYGYLSIVGGVAAFIFAGPVLAALLWKSGIGDRVFDGLHLDNSAAVRLRIYDVFDYTSLADLLFGLSPAQIVVVSAQIGLDPAYEAIENFWLLMLLQLGVPIFALFAGGLFSGLALLWRMSGAGGRWALVVFVATASTTNSLASKTAALTMLFSILFCVAATGWRFAPTPRTCL